MTKIRTLLFLLFALAVTSGPALAGQRGILLLAHGGNEQWNAQITRIAAEVDKTYPTEIAFGMATRANIQGAVDRLRARGATEIVAVPLFVSSWSSVITSTEYLLGQRKDAPKELAIFAKMDHSAHGNGGHGAAATGTAGGHDGHAGHAVPDPTSPIETPLPIRMTRALNDHPIVAEILADRARSVSTDPATEAVVIVAHGPVADEENQRWLADMKSLAERVSEAGRFAKVDYLTLRDDAPKPVRDAATAELRQVVSGHIDAGRRVLIVPLLVSFGGIEKGLRERLEGLAYTMPSAALVPDDRIVSWVLEMANGQ
jgi:sirohydrochlorin cobaltochelatase